MPESAPQPRRSKRKAALTSAVRLDESSEDERVDVAVVKPPRKRMRSSAASKDAAYTKEPKRKTNKRAKLGLLPNMPLDVLLEIFTHLHPSDLLRMSRTTKNLRNLLLNRSSRSLWIDVLSCIPGLPPCPSDMTEPSYSHLVFESICSLCGAPRVREVHWAVRMRVCSTCASREPGKAFTSHTTAQSIIPDVQNIVPWVSGMHKNNLSTWLYRTDQLSAVREALQSFKDDPEAEGRYRMEKAALMKEVRSHTSDCIIWYSQLRDDHSDELESLRIKRREAIEERLREAGFGREVDWINGEGGHSVRRSFQYHKHVRQPKALTERIWKNMERGMAEFSEDIRVKRADWLWRRILTKRGRVLADVLKKYALENPSIPRRALPNAADLYHESAAFKRILTTPLTEDEQDEVTAESFADAISELPKVLEGWEVTKRSVLLSLLPNNLAEPHDGQPTEDSQPAPSLNRLSFATSLFVCSRCDDDVGLRVFHSSNIHQHQCSFTSYGCYTISKDSDQKVNNALEAYPWIGSRTSVVYSQSAAEKAENLVKLCDLDPETTTLEDMDTLNARFTCICPRCSISVSHVGVVGLSWRQAVVFSMRHDAKLTRLSEEDAAELQRAESEAEFSNIAFGGAHELRKAWSCTRCGQGQLTARILTAHMKQAHDTDVVGKDDAAPDADCFAPAVKRFCLLNGKGVSTAPHPFGSHSLLVDFSPYIDNSDSDNYDGIIPFPFPYGMFGPDSEDESDENYNEDAYDSGDGGGFGFNF